jgi:hypothetical protein
MYAPVHLPTPDAPRVRNVALDVMLTRDSRTRYLIAALAGIPPNVLGGIVSGRVIATPSAQARLAEVLGVSVADIFEVTQ